MTTSKNYYRVMLGQKSVHADECHKGGFIGGDWGMNFDFTNELPDTVQAFNAINIPRFIANDPSKGKVSAGLCCGMLFTICKRIKTGDIVLCPDGDNSYLVGEVTGEYAYVPGGILPHRRSVKWREDKINFEDRSPEFKRSASSLGTISNVTKYWEEIESLLQDGPTRTDITDDDATQDPVVFALEAHLEDFLVRNWAQTELGKTYDIVENDGELIGQQYPCDTGRLDILAISKDQKEFLVVELKKGRASDAVVGQIQRYMGFILDEIANDDQTVRGIIIALEDDLRIRRALRVADNVEFYRYQMSFSLARS